VLEECGFSPATRCSEMQGLETVRYSNPYSRPRHSADAASAIGRKGAGRVL
jgi:hypothetical protein